MMVKAVGAVLCRFCAPMAIIHAIEVQRVPTIVAGITGWEAEPQRDKWRPSCCCVLLPLLPKLDSSCSPICARAPGTSGYTCMHADVQLHSEGYAGHAPMPGLMRAHALSS
eukprot:scaffold29942_cov17-Tisochrysis_lutea.AAC.2